MTSHVPPCDPEVLATLLVIRVRCSRGFALTVAQIVRATGLDFPTVHEHVAELRDAGVVVIDRVPTGPGMAQWRIRLRPERGELLQCALLSAVGAVLANRRQ